MPDRGDRVTEIVGRITGPRGLVQVVALRAVTHLVGAVKGRAVLDLACGDGTLSRWLALHGAHVTGVDRSPGAIEAARKQEQRDPHGISYLTADAEDLYMIDDSSFEDVVCNLSLGRMENLSAVIGEVARVIRLGGRFVFSVPHPCFVQLTGTPEDSEDRPDYYAEGHRSSSHGPLCHRTLATYINAVAARGFTVRRLAEPAADKRDVSSRPDLKGLDRVPLALAVEAIFPHL